jgi:hypothetical protein
LPLRKKSVFLRATVEARDRSPHRYSATPLHVLFECRTGVVHNARGPSGMCCALTSTNKTCGCLPQVHHMIHGRYFYEDGYFSPSSLEIKSSCRRCSNLCACVTKSQILVCMSWKLRFMQWFLPGAHHGPMRFDMKHAWETGTGFQPQLA